MALLLFKVNTFIHIITLYLLFIKFSTSSQDHTLSKNFCSESTPNMQFNVDGYKFCWYLFFFLKIYFSFIFEKVCSLQNLYVNCSGEGFLFCCKVKYQTYCISTEKICPFLQVFKSFVFYFQQFSLDVYAQLFFSYLSCSGLVKFFDLWVDIFIPFLENYWPVCLQVLLLTTFSFTCLSRNQITSILDFSTMLNIKQILQLFLVGQFDEYK